MCDEHIGRPYQWLSASDLAIRTTMLGQDDAPASSSLLPSAMNIEVVFVLLGTSFLDTST